MPRSSWTTISMASGTSAGVSDVENRSIKIMRDASASPSRVSCDSRRRAAAADAGSPSTAYTRVAPARAAASARSTNGPVPISSTVLPRACRLNASAKAPQRMPSACMCS